MTNEERKALQHACLSAATYLERGDWTDTDAAFADGRAIAAYLRDRAAKLAKVIEARRDEDQ